MMENCNRMDPLETQLTPLIRNGYTGFSLNMRYFLKTKFCRVRYTSEDLWSNRVYSE